MSQYKTVEANKEVNHIIEKSKFIGYVKPVGKEEDAEAFIESIRTMHKEATHNVPIYLIGRQFEVQKYSDDGEPSGTAGISILEMLKKEGITNIAMVITRYFGGVKLGTGGLVRAYTNTAKLALEAAKVIRMVEHQLIKIKTDYTFLGKIQNTINNNGWRIKDTEFGEWVTLYVYCLPEKSKMLEEMMTDLTNGQCEIQNVAREYLKME
ncbi:MAG: YigZ family protein [Clostridia bacterium]|nr:YigZ family protein [Clostridia bacterium]